MAADLAFRGSALALWQAPTRGYKACSSRSRTQHLKSPQLRCAVFPAYCPTDRASQAERPGLGPGAASTLAVTPSTKRVVSNTTQQQVCRVFPRLELYTQFRAVQLSKVVRAGLVLTLVVTLFKR